MKQLLSTWILILTSLSVQAEPVPAYYPKFFPNSGVVSEINIGAGTMVVQDKRVFFGNDLRVHTTRTRSASMLNIQPGTRIGYKYTPDAQGRPMVFEIWVLPPRQPALPLP